MRLGIIANLAHRTIAELVPGWLSWLAARAQVVVAEDLARFLNLPSHTFTTAPREQVFVNCDMVISLGGDGTILSTAHLIGDSGVPILGVKFGGLGFLVELGPEELYVASENILAGKYQIQERMVLQGRVSDEPEVFLAMNDIVLDKGGHPRLIRLRTSINQEYLTTYIADGLIVATPTGSTAYSLAAGGPILPPEMKAMVITPICPHSLSARPVVIPDEKEVRIEVVSADTAVNLSADGRVTRQIPPSSSISIWKADFHVNLVRKTTPESSGFYDTLRAKLHWGEDSRK